MRIPLVLLALVLPLFSGCLGGEEGPTAEAPAIASSKEEAGATDGPAPSAAKNPYQVSASEYQGDEAAAESVTVYPVAIQTNAPKPPVALTFDGEFGPDACNQAGGIPFGWVVGASGSHFHEFADSLASGDVFSYQIEMRYTNTDDAWAEMHLGYGIGGANTFWTEPTGSLRGEVVMNFTGQSYRVRDDDWAWVRAECWYGATTKAIPYTLSVTLTFADAAVPSGSPVLLEVPDGATRLFVTGVALDPSRGVSSHYRLFAPDDSLVCECGLGSTQEASSLQLPGPGAYVILVDHTDNGFVSFAMDTPPTADLLPLETEGALYPILSATGGTVDETVLVDLPTTPLSLDAWVFPPGFPSSETPDLGMGHRYQFTLTNARGEVIGQTMEGWITTRLVVPGALWTSNWYPIPTPTGVWEFRLDHHAFAPGGHEAHVKADALRGEIALFAIHYVRP